MNTRKIGKLTEISATNGYLHKKGSETYEECKKRILLPTESESDYEEIAELPKYTREEYEKKVSELIRERYTSDEESAIVRKVVNLMLNPSLADEAPKNEDGLPFAVDEFNAYNTFAEDCKVRAKEILANKEDEPMPVPEDEFTHADGETPTEA